MSGLQAIMDNRPECVILDLGLPDIDGSELIRMVRAVSQVPIVVATARGDEAAMVSILAQCADDYVVKPFGPSQLDARIRPVLLRTVAPTEPDVPLVIGQLRIDTASS